MAGQRQDYILRQIDLLRQFVARLAGRKPDRETEEALLLAFDLQAKLLPLPVPEFLQLDLPAQIEALRRDLPRAAGHERCLTFAGIIVETAKLYAHKGDEELAAGARQMALYAALACAVDEPAGGPADALVAELVPALDLRTLHEPVVALLTTWSHQRAAAS